MATHSISGNAVTATEKIYLNPVTGGEGTSQITVTDGSGNYSFTGVTDGVYDIRTDGNPLAIKQVVVAGSNTSDVNFAV